MDYLNEAYKEALKAYKKDEVPVGCVIVLDDKIIARAYNKRNKKNNPILHAEMICIQRASKKLKSWRLEDCIMYVTLEPCQMCTGAIIQSRIKKVYYGAVEPKSGCMGGFIDLTEYKFNHKVEVELLNDEKCIKIMSDFFKEKRIEKTKNK